MKTKKQVQAYLQSHYFATASDLSLVIAFCQKERILTPKDFPTFTNPGHETAQSFIEWFEHGFGHGDIALLNDAGTFVLVSGNDLHSVETCASRTNDSQWDIVNGSYSSSSLSHIDGSMAGNMIADLARKGWEFDEEVMAVRKKYIPSPNERVEFSSGDHIGIGVVRSVDVPSGEIELYCYFWYDTKEIGHSMKETGVCDLYSFHYRPQSVIATRRMNRELNKLGKLWNDKLHRVEPIECKAENGGKYFYINDKMKVIQEREKGTPTSHFRYISGNYFLSYEEASEYQNKFNELLRYRLAESTSE